ncbi:MAG: CvpA family protein [Bacteroidales bacterium]|nr:CvpA family protein [Bacteroidales bacterium]
MTFVDTITVLLFVASVVIGYMRGLVRQATSLLGYILGIIACNMFGDTATDILLTVMPSAAEWPLASVTTHAVAVIVLFLLISLSVRVAGMFLRSVIGMLHLGIVDNIGGSALCLFKYFFIFSILLNLWLMVNPTSDTFTTEHILGNRPFVETINLAPRVLGAETLPGDSLKTITREAEQIEAADKAESDESSLI